MKPILFNTDMVRAILAGRKTATRRVVKPQPEGAHSILDCDEEKRTFDLLCGNGSVGGVFVDWAETIKAPFWPGDILYVQETFQIDYLSNIPGTGRVHYKADDSYSDFSFVPVRYEMMRRAQLKPGWRSNANMPREAARIFMRVTNVYPQWLRDTTEADARAEGFRSRDEFMSAILKMYPDCTENSWFWIIEFERIAREECAM